MQQSGKKRVKIENKIKSIQDRIKLLESSFYKKESHSILEEDDDEVMDVVEIIDIPEENVSNSEPTPTLHSAPNIPFTKNRDFSKKNISVAAESMIENQSQDAAVILSDLMKERDQLQQTNKKQSLKIETLEFRCQKLNEELKKRVPRWNDVNEQLERLKDHKSRLEQQLQQTARESQERRKEEQPNLQKLKTQNEVIELELQSIENDNRVLDSRVIELEKLLEESMETNCNSKALNGKLEIERLTLKLEVEQLTQKFIEYQNQVKHTQIKIEEISFENKRMANECEYFNRRTELLGITDPEISRQASASKLGDSNRKVQEYNSSKVIRNPEENLTYKKARNLTVSISNNKSLHLTSNELAAIENRLKTLNS